MCGIIGYLNKNINGQAPLGEICYRMLSALARRGPDSAGLATFGTSNNSRLILCIKLDEKENLEDQTANVLEKISGLTHVHEQLTTKEYLRLIIEPVEDSDALIAQVESTAKEVELVSLGTQLEIIKQVGSPDSLERHYGIRSKSGTHAIGHTRLSTESRVDLSHSQPFWAHGVADLATAHNGHITNYHKLRRQYEQRGIRFYTENDSEIIGIYLRDQMEQGSSLEEALWASLEDFDGSFSYLAANNDCLAYVKDPFALKPLMVGESEEFVALATEEIALRKISRKSFEVWEAPAQHVQLWSVPTHTQETF